MPRPATPLKRPPEVRALVSFCLAFAALLLAGCAGYRLGPTNGDLAGARSVRIDPLVNKTLEPNISDYLQNSLRKGFQRDGTFQVNTHQEGDVILSGVILTYTRREASFNPADVVSVLDYEITATAQFTARERSTGKVLLDKPVKATTTLRAGTDLTSAERQAVPVLADDLARKAIGLLVDGSW